MIFTHPDQPQMQAEVILASTADKAPALTTMRLRYPRIIHSEIMTHRVFSRNARSSRAVPVSRMIDEIRNTPFVPWHWGKNQKGMQAGEEHDARIGFNGESNAMSREEYWRFAAQNAVAFAEAFTDAGYHKQICNRLLEPFMWIDTLVTSTDWANFLWLRDHKDAEPHLQDLARLVEQAITGHEVHQYLEPGDWHLPYFDHRTDGQWCMRQTDNKTISGDAHWEAANQLACKLSAARCARISYAPFDGDASYERELERYNSLVDSDRVHASPLEHQATPDHRSLEEQMSSCLAGNLGPGWIQYRKTVPGERYTEVTL